MHHRQLPRHCQHRALARRICKLGRRASDQRNYTGGVDHTRLVLAMLPETEHSVLAAKPHAFDVNSLSEIPDLLGGVDSVIVQGVHDAGVVEEDVESAPGVDVLYHGLDI